MAAQQDSPSASDHAALADGFRPLEAVNPGLPERLVRYVSEGYDESVQSALASTPNAAVLLGMNLSYAGLPPPSRQTPLPAWDALLQHHAEVPVLVLLRFAKVMSWALGPGNLIFYASGRAVAHQAVSALQSLSPPPWLELMVRLGAKPEYAPGIFPMHQNRLSAEVIERMLQADGHSPEIIYHKTFPTMRYDVVSMQVVSLVGGLAGFGERIAERPELVTDALRDSSAGKPVLAVETLERLAIPIVPFLDDLARLATGPAKTLREAASALIVRAGEAALQPLRPIAESGKPDEKGHALCLIARLDLPEGKAFLHQRIARETAPGVLKVLKELAIEEAPATTPPPRPLSDADIFAGVELGQETRAALAAWAKNVAVTDLDEAFAWLTQPTPWTGDPRSILARAANGNAEGMKILFQRPELTPSLRSWKTETRSSITSGRTSTGAAASLSKRSHSRVTNSTSCFSSRIGWTVSKLNRRLSALDISCTPRSRVLAVPITLKPGRAYSTRSGPTSSGTIIIFSERMLTSVFWISGGQRVISSNRASSPSRIAT